MRARRINCAGMESKLAGLLLDPNAAPAKVQGHVEQCGNCKSELEELKATMALLDSWEGPEPSPYFLLRLEARMKEEREAAPAGWLKRRLSGWFAAFVYGSHARVRPLAAMALTTLLFLGGGAYLGLTNWDQVPAPARETAVVQDLQTLANNAQLLDQLEALSTNDTNNSGN